MDSSVNLLANMVSSEDMLPSPSNTFEDEEDDDSEQHLDETPMELDDN